MMQLLFVLFMGSCFGLSAQQEGDTLLPDLDASFPGGPVALQQFLNEHLQYPLDDVLNRVQGKVIVTFIVDRDGSIRMPKIEKGLSTTIDQECLRVVRLMPDWIPSREDGVLYPTKIRLPINMVLPEPKEQQTQKQKRRKR